MCVPIEPVGGGSGSFWIAYLAFSSPLFMERRWIGYRLHQIGIQTDRNSSLKHSQVVGLATPGDVCGCARNVQQYLARLGLSFQLDTSVLIGQRGHQMLHKSAIELAKKGPAEIWIASRNKVKGEEAVAEIQKLAEVDSSRPLVRFLELDLASFDSIKAAAQVLLASIDRIDILMLNAWILGGPVSTTAQGYEMQWGVNHVGHALLFKLLLPRLLETTERPGDDGDVRVISLSSIAHHVPVRGSIVWETLKSDEASLYPVQRYGQSKMANLVYAAEMARRYPQLTSVSCVPGHRGNRHLRERQRRRGAWAAAPLRLGPRDHGRGRGQDADLGGDGAQIGAGQRRVLHPRQHAWQDPESIKQESRTGQEALGVDRKRARGTWIGLIRLGGAIRPIGSSAGGQYCPLVAAGIGWTD
ncbi:hypothetical protein RB600_002337 [Gaeumannomyces tritici]